MDFAFPQPSTSKWLLYAVPAACLTTSYMIYTQRRTLFGWVYGLAAKNPKPAGQAYLSGNFGPVHEELLEEVQVVEGKLPEGLEGCFVRNGPNPFFKPAGGYHWFDGDGMLHLVRIRDGRASYCNRFVDTERLRQERAAGRPLFMRLGDMYGVRGLALLVLNKLGLRIGAMTTANGAGTANTALVYHAGRLLALHEGDLPYAVRILCSGLMETMGRLRVDPSWNRSFTAHPKRDPVNGELMFLGYSVETKPYVKMGIMDEQGRMTRQWAVELPRPVMMHDMAATERYLVVLDLPLCFEPEAMVKDKTVPFKLRKDFPSRIGLLRRDQPSCPEGPAEVQWFEFPTGFMAFHVANAWDEANGDVKVYACQMDDLTLDLEVMQDRELARLTEYTLSPSTGTATSRRLTEVVGDFPVVHPGKATRPCKWSYVAVMDGTSCMPAFTGIAKMDLGAAPGTDACVGMVKYPAGTLGGEAVFVPRDGATAEDDGYLVVYVYDDKENASYMNVYDARSMASTPLASLRMPRRVPYGFHGTWVTEEQLKKQLHWI
ncbi:hypothetical protein PLESTB_000836900 [Pleodorina starrii]|uniref:carotenoid 9,10-dioxygenase n=1 Tax=Pleodorina starrii TaxID=330485 RepID=A0A9W6F2H0_9CHLO|nr:hypothetical protein PLESTB_000836900 [Pleodorina starrii]GLC64475.1 hypothetical protein PLESTF_000169900 [Pleodorina starrii]